MIRWKQRSVLFIAVFVAVVIGAAGTAPAQNVSAPAVGNDASKSDSPRTDSKGSTVKDRDAEEVQAEHATIGVETKRSDFPHTTHPEAQWFTKAGLGLFIHWGLASVRASNISWPMIPGRAIAARPITDPAERERIIRQQDWNLNGKPNSVTPNEYWSVAPNFNPQDYDPDKWLKAAKAAGFEYAVLTAKHHEGFALWPSAYGDFSTKSYMGGRDLVKEYVEACRKNGLKVGLYFSGPDWHFDRDYMSFLYHANQVPWMPSLGPDLKPRTTKHAPDEIAEHQKQFAELVKGQIEELLTNYGRIDLIWFDGKPAVPNADRVITIERIRQLQPQIVINPRLHGHGDFVTYERRLTTDKIATGWAELCNTWTSSWSHEEIPFRSNAYHLGQLATCRSLGINYLLGVGPTKDGIFVDDIYKNMAIVGQWMAKHRAAVKDAAPLPSGETASVPATASQSVRYLFAIPKFRSGGTYDRDMLPMETVEMQLSGVSRPQSVKLIGDGSPLEFTYSDQQLTVTLPVEKRSNLVDVVQVDLPPALAADDFAPPKIPLPTFADKAFNVKEFGALGDGQSNDTSAVNRAIERCSSEGGGTIRFPTGKYMVASVHLLSNIRFLLDDGAIIEGRKDGYDPPEPNPNEKYQDFGHGHFHNAVMWGENIENFAVIGGQVNGGGVTTGNPKPGGGDKVFAIKGGKNLLFENVTHVTGGHFVYLLNDCENVTIDHDVIQKSRDAIDLMGCRNVAVTGCHYTGCGDDTLGIKSDYALGRRIKSQNIYAWDNYFESGCNALQFGSETAGDFEHIRIWNIKIGLAMKAGIGITCNDSGRVEDVRYRNIEIKGAANPIYMLITDRLRTGEMNVTPGTIKDIVIQDVTVEKCAAGRQGDVNPTSITALPEYPIENVTLENVNIVMPGGGSSRDAEIVPPYPKDYSPRSLGSRPASAFFIRNVRGLTLKNVSVSFEKPDGRSPLAIMNSDDVTLNHVSITDKPSDVDMLRLTNVKNLTVHDSPNVPDVVNENVKKRAQ